MDPPRGTAIRVQVGWLIGSKSALAGDVARRPWHGGNILSMESTCKSWHESNLLNIEFSREYEETRDAGRNPMAPTT